MSDKLEDLRIVVILNEANPELLEELSRISPRARAERVRVLANMGLSLTRGRLDAGNLYARPAAPGLQAAPVDSTQLARPVASAFDVDEPRPIGAAVQQDVIANGETVSSQDAETVRKHPSKQLSKFVKSLS